MEKYYDMLEDYCEVNNYDWWEVIEEHIEDFIKYNDINEEDTTFEKWLYEVSCDI